MSFQKSILHSFYTYIQILRLSRKIFGFWHVVLIVFHPLFAKVKTIRRRGQVIAFAIYSFDKLQYLGVAKEHSGKGVARKLLSKVRSQIIYLRVSCDNLRSIAFFKKSGFKLKRYKNTLFGRRAVFVHARRA